jgi:hypothetical protein
MPVGIRTLPAGIIKILVGKIMISEELLAKNSIKSRLCL